MADPFIAEIRVFGFNFAPKGWAHCDGQLLPKAQNTALFSLLSTTYGGNGTTTFALPNLRDRTTLGAGQGPGLSNYDLGQEEGTQIVTLLESEIPSHTHGARARNDPAELQAPAPDRALARSTAGFAYQSNTSANLVPMAPETAAAAGASFPHNNMPPVLTLNFCIALQGVFPPHP
jgi:microcystin-dependent protein